MQTYTTHVCLKMAAIIMLSALSALACLASLAHYMPLTTTCSAVIIIYHAYIYCNAWAFKRTPKGIRRLTLTHDQTFLIETADGQQYPVRLQHAWIGHTGFWACFQTGHTSLMLISCDDLPPHLIRIYLRFKKDSGEQA